MIPSTVERVQHSTTENINAKIRRDTEARLVRCAAAGLPAIERRLDELDHEWDIERLLEANASTAVLVGVALGAALDRRFFLLPAVVGGFLLQHAVQGWCPPLPLFRRLGFRTQSEIEQERYALKAMRGDFRNVPTLDRNDARPTVRQALAAVEC